MYAGSSLTRISGSVIGAHHKIDRVARRHLEMLVPDIDFPKISDILQFEGNKGPDSIKRKSPAKNEPWHYIQPFDEKDTQLIDIITDHYKELVKALKNKDNERASFEAAWLAHAVVDGLTPAHHYPYEEKLTELRNGEGLENRTTWKKKLIMPGETSSETMKNNWKMWGPKGLMTTHMAFEIGIATLIAPITFNEYVPSVKILTAPMKEPLSRWFRSTAQKVAKLNMYNRFYEDGWTIKLSHQVKQELVPAIINAVTAVWYSAYVESRPTIKS